ncbi:nuclear transport factor 2 family protein [Geodermatophilus marinus]|uniref:nuclear transport factor 2 family protein n=1 Tax=Geodermatophilus sp. LHW52908 TaxID=2303986 RepID=UPI000E3C2488|nr:nuclear transport factor 2 family protein [Geodermatophilus sp. LHW52908]RFU21168.1 nuclear transport factor 2 family protein [Geodermatophilus sp. LHW52908]
MTEAREAVERFNEAFARHDVDAVMAAMTEDCVFESTSPPDGERHEGQAAVRTAWEELFTSTPGGRIDAEEVVPLGDRVVVRWVYRWPAGDGGEGHVRGIDLFRVRDGRVAEKLSYVKG